MRPVDEVVQGRTALATGGQRALQAAARALWDAVIPALLSVLMLRDFVPASASGIEGVVAGLGRRQGPVLAAALFVVFSGLLRYWRFWIPGGRYASALPAHIAPDARGSVLAEWAEGAQRLSALGSGPARRALEREPTDTRALVGAQVAELRRALETGNLAQLRDAVAKLRVSAQAALRARRRREMFVAALTVGAAAAASLALRAFVAQPYHVLSGSMLPTFETDDIVGGNKLGRAGTAEKGLVPHRGDVVVFQSSAVALGEGAFPAQLVKRVIGLPGDRVAMRGGMPILNDWQVPSCDAGRYTYVLPGGGLNALVGRIRVEFLGDRTYLTLHAAAPMAFETTYVVQPGEVFVLGDNRNNSLDSRAWNYGRGGGVTLAAIDARVQWFLVGTHLSGDWDFGRLFRSVDSLQAQVRIEGVDRSDVEAGIARCLAKRPTETWPPGAQMPTATGSSEPSGT